MNLAVRILAVAGALAVTAVGQALAAPITITTAVVTTTAFDIGLTDGDVDSSTAYGVRTVTSQQGVSIATTQRNWQDTGSGAVFDFDFAQRRSGLPNAYADTDGYVDFTVGAADVSYVLSGLFAMSGPANRIVASMSLVDRSTGVALFGGGSLSEDTADESFTLGVAGGGDLLDLLEGSLTGTLLAGHDYRLDWAYFIQAAPRSDNGATASGCLTLSLNGAAGDGLCGVGANAVPEPGSLALALAALALAARRRGREPFTG